jgi:hypothetical protein
LAEGISVASGSFGLGACFLEAGGVTDSPAVGFAGGVGGFFDASSELGLSADMVYPQLNLGNGSFNQPMS